jgi:ATP-dependent DNA helicase RecG
MPENQNVEYKSSWRDEYLKWICGFANAQGGKLYIGIDDNGKVCGVQNAKKLMEDIPNKIQTCLGFVNEINKRERGGLEYIEIVVDPSSYPVSYHGEFHYRSGATKGLLSCRVY